MLQTAPRQFRQHARNPARSIEIGGNNTVLAPAYGPPFVRDLEKGRRYGTIADFQNFVRLAMMSPGLHHSGGTVCEPVDVPVNKRHLDMVLAHILLSDKPFMGAVTAPERAQDTVDMAKIVFGEEFVDQNCVVVNVINANSPMVFDGAMLGALKVYARNNQGCLISPFILSGAMSPVTIGGTLSQILAEVLAGSALTQLIRPGAPVVFGTFAATTSMLSGAPTFGTPESEIILFGAAQLARRLGLPFRSGGGLCSSKIPDAQAAYESANTLKATALAGVHFALHTAGWLEGGLVMGYEKFIMDADQAQMIARLLSGVELDENEQALSAIEEVGPGTHFLGCTHTRENFERAFYRSPISDYDSYEQWEANGATNMARRASEKCKTLLKEYEPPPMESSLENQLRQFVKERKDSVPDSWI